MKTRLVVVAHGIGDHGKDFHLTWESVLRKIHPDGKFDVVGLWWDDVLDKVASHYPLIDEQFAEAAAKFGFPVLKKALDSGTYAMVHEHLMDILVYCALADMRHYVQSTCVVRLKKATEGRAADTILIGHSLGSAMLVHVTMLEYQSTGAIPYQALVNLASPLGMVSPRPRLIPDPLRITPGMAASARNEVLEEISYAWSVVGDDRLRFLINENDIVCADAPMKVGNKTIDLIPIRQGFTAKEDKALNRYSENAVVRFKSGSSKASEILKNHAVERYLGHSQFSKIFKALVP